MRMNLNVVAGAGIGALAALLLDSDRGARRRALLSDKFVYGLRKGRDAAGATGRDLGHRARGVVARVQSRMHPSDASDDVVVERVRAKLGRFVSHARAIDVDVRDGVVTLTGPILASEVKPLLKAITGVRGVVAVRDNLESHDQADNIPSLQGGAARLGEPAEIWQEQWSPATRCLVGCAGGTLALYGAARRDVLGAALAVAGIGIALRGWTNLDTAKLTGIGAGRRAIDVQKTIEINAPVEQVFAFWCQFENFPRFMSHVREVQATRIDGQTHWVVDGPAGAPIQFDAVVTEFCPNEVIAWRTEGPAAVRHAGIVRFEATANGTTRVSIRMSYNPPGGAAGHAAASLLGADLKSRLDDDLLRMKSFIDTGKPAHDAARSDGAEPVVM
jgi:uncharacterized membrane protein